MSKKVLTRGQKTARFWLIMAIYAMVFLLLVTAGLIWFWDWIAAYENACPAQEAIDAYSSQLDQDMLLDMQWETFEKVDSRLQSQEECRAILKKELSGKFVFAKSLALSTEDKVVYEVKRNIKTVGRVTVEKISTDRYGFETWAVTEEVYDVEYILENLLGKTQTITAPSNFTVYANDQALGEEFIVNTRREYRLNQNDGGSPTGFEEVVYHTYEVGAILGTVTLRADDGSGNGPTEDTRQMLEPCDGAVLSDIEAFLDDYVDAYVGFTTVRYGKDNTMANYRRLIQYIVDGSRLENRMRDSISGLEWISDRRATVQDITVNACFQMEDGTYLCDFTYVVESLVQGKMTPLTENVLMVITDASGKMLAESMLSQ